MGFFPSVNPILADLDRQGISDAGDDWDKRVVSAILDLNAAYGNGNLLIENRKLIDYGDLATQAAYVFMYVAGHADFLFSVFNRGLEEGAFDGLRKEEVHVTSIGGGPGSDLLALVRLLRTFRPEHRPRVLRYRVLDKQPNWHEILRTVAASQQGTIDIDVTFEHIDVTDHDTWEGMTCKDDDLLILNFFVSEVCKLREAESVKKCLKTLLGSVASGADVVFNDSKFPSCYEYFDKRIDAVGGYKRHVAENARLDAEPDFDEFFRDCMARFGRTPKLASNAAYRVLEKK